MYFLTPLAVLAGSLVAGVQATSQFSLPPAAGPEGNYRDNPTYKVGDDLDIQWTSDLDNMDLTLWQEYPPANAADGTFWFKKLQENSRSTSMIWTVSFDSFSTDVAKGEDAVFFLAVYLTGSDAFDTSSHYFNVTVDDAQTTSMTATSTAVAGDITRDPTAVTSDPTATATSDPGKDDDNNKDDGGLSTGATAGIAVGATLGGLIILGAAGFFAWRHFRKTPGDASGQYNATSQQPPPTEQYYQGQQGQQGYAPNGGFVAGHQGSPPVQEYYKPQTTSPGPTEASELPGGQWTHGQHPQTNVQSGPVYEAP